MIADLPSNQAERLEALRRYDILDTPFEAAYDHICKLASLICQTPIAVINFIDDGRQWFKSEIGLGVRETPLAPSICAHAILQEDLFVVPDTLLDERFADNPLCISTPHLRFYAGALLKTEDNFPLGTLCVLDYLPRTLKSAEREALQMLSAQVMHLLEMRRTWRALRDSEEFSRSVMDSSADCVKILDLEGRLIAMNKAGCLQMQVDDFAICLNASWLAFWEQDRVSAETAMNLALSGNQGRFRGACRTLKGIPKYWDVILTPIRVADGEIVKLLCVSRDITEHRRIEDQLRNSAKLESLGVMAGGIAHDFNNLLTGILGNASLLVESVSPEDRELAEDIVKASEQAANLTRQMLAFSGKGRFAVSEVNLSERVREILPLIKSSTAGIPILLELDLDLPDIKADPGQIQQVVMNLVINAAEAMEGKSGSVIIKTEAVELDQARLDQLPNREGLSIGPYVSLEVIDSGVGMNEVTKAKIFDPFFTTKFTGRGLGLAAVSGIVRGHNGSLHVESTPGRGTTFKILFPAHDFIERKPLTEELPHRDMEATILFIDDEEVVRKIGNTALERSGFSVRLAASGEEAVTLFRSAPNDVSLIVLDMTMPGMDGERTFEQLRAIRADVPIVVSSGYNEVEVIRRFTDSNIAGFIQKPYSAATFIAKVTAILALQPGHV